MSKKMAKEKRLRKRLVIPRREPDFRIYFPQHNWLEQYWFAEMVSRTVIGTDKTMRFRLLVGDDGVLTEVEPDSTVYTVGKPAQLAYLDYIAEKYLLLGGKDD